MKKLAVLAAAAALWGCVPIPGVQPLDDRPVTTGVFRPLDAGAVDQESLHFKVRCYGSHNLQRISDSAEKAYNRIMLDTNLYSFRPRGLYEIVVYGTKDEFLKKTGMPEWSAGVSVGNAIYSFDGPHLAGTLAHEMTHLIFFEFMGRSNQQLRWLNEGLAVLQESSAQNSDRDAFASQRVALRQNPMTLEQLVNLVPATERENRVSLWYAQAESMVRFLIERGGRLGFSQFLESLRDGHAIDAALSRGFPGKWSKASDMERDWLTSLM